MAQPMHVAKPVVSLVSSDEPSYVELRGVRKIYPSGGGAIEALSDITVDIRQGEFLTILGPSGCGKSTLLKCIAGLQDISGGTIRIRGEVVRSAPAGLGVVFQRDLLLDWRTVTDNILLSVEFLGLRRRDFVERTRQLLDRFGLGAYGHRYPWELSGGMRQRVAICRALLDNPDFLLMDEPFGALDAMTRDDLNIELQRLWLADRKTVLFITHSIAEAVLLSDRVLVMNRNPGRIAREFVIDLPRPRRLIDRDHPSFAHASAEINRAILEMGVVHDA